MARGFSALQPVFKNHGLISFGSLKKYCRTLQKIGANCGRRVNKDAASRDLTQKTLYVGLDQSHLLEEPAEEVPDAAHSLAEGINDGNNGMEGAHCLRRCPREVSLPQRLRA